MYFTLPVKLEAGVRGVNSHGNWTNAGYCVLEVRLALGFHVNETCVCGSDVRGVKLALVVL